MCGADTATAEPVPQRRGKNDSPVVIEVDDLRAIAERLVREPEMRRSAAGFVGFGATQPGDRILIGADSETDPDVYGVLARALRDRGASVDVVVVHVEEDREFGDLDEIEVTMRREPWVNQPRRWEGVPWVEELAKTRKYDLLIHGKGGAIPKVDHRYEGFPWIVKEHFASEANIYPRELHRLINEKTWARITDNTGSRLTVTDPEGTNLELTILDKPLSDPNRHDYGMTPKWGHLMAHPPTPIEPEDDTVGVIKGTMGHFGRPFPPIELEIEKSKLMEVRGGGNYGAAWRELMEESKDTKYPCFPEPGLFWLWEIAIGTNPKIVRPDNIAYHSSGGFEWERRRAGVIHCGLGTRWRGTEEVWAGENHLLYGHLHCHLLFPTVTVHTPTGEVPVIEHGRLSAYDDPEVRDCAATFGDPDELLHDDWVPTIPGINAEGSYEDYCADPSSWIYGRQAG
jgi:hypothetical protein